MSDMPEVDFRAQIEAARADMATWPQWMRDAAHFRCAAAPVPKAQLQEIDDLRAEIEALRTLATDAYKAWNSDSDARVGKLLRAMIDTEFRRGYRPDLRPNALAQGRGD